MPVAVKIITEGDLFYSEVIKLIHSAKHSVSFMMYIWQDDEIGKKFETALASAARRGLNVRLVIDAIGSFDLSSLYIHRLRSAGVVVYTHNRLKILKWGWLRYLIRRNHRKIVLIDDRIAFTGGFNIMRECSRQIVGDQRWLDMMLQTRIPQFVAGLKQQFQDACRRSRHKKWTSRLLSRSGNRVLISSGRRIFSYSMSRWLKRRLRHARSKITIAVPYFIPYGFYWRILTQKMKQGVEVEIILSLSSDLPWIDAVSFALAGKLMKRGASVFLYHGASETPRFSHTKLYRIDRWAGTGSANYDYRSMVLNLDTLVFFRQPPEGWTAAYTSLRTASRIATPTDLKTGFRAWLIWPFRWLL